MERPTKLHRKTGALTLTRYVGALGNPKSTIQIGDDIRIAVTEVRGANVRICIQAPGDVRVMRLDLLQDGDFEKYMDSQDTAGRHVTGPGGGEDADSGS